MSRDDLETLVCSHQAELYRYVRFLGVNDRAAAEDLVQDTFLAAFRSPEPPPLAEVLRRVAWLRGIARNLFLAHCRRHQNSPVHIDSLYLERAEAFWAAEFVPEGGPDYLQALKRCLESLAEKPRRLLEMRYTQKTSRSEMARLLRMSEDGIKSALQRVRALLGDCIRRQLEAEKAHDGPA